MNETNYGISKDFLYAMVELAKIRIRKAYDLTDGDTYLSFSGGKDSTIVAELVKMTYLPSKIPFVFANTGIELRATLDFVKQYDYDNIHIIKPRKPFGHVLKEFGFPAISKLKSDLLSTYQKNIDNPMEFARCRQLITGEMEKGGVKQGKLSQVALKFDDFHFLHPDLEYKVANKCCQYMKKYPFEDFAKEYGMKGTITGMRRAEGGVRAMKHSTCTTIKKLNNEEFIQISPIIDWSDELCDMFIEEFNVKLSKAYTEYGCVRTGCAGCPFSRNVGDELKILHDHEPLMYKATMKWLKNVYLDQGVECPWDGEYMKELEERTVLNNQRKVEMVQKFKPHFNPEVRTKTRYDSFMKKLEEKDRM